MKNILDLLKKLNYHIVFIIILVLIDSLVKNISIVYVYMIAKIFTKKLDNKEITLILIITLLVSFLTYNPIGLQTFILGIISMNYIAFKDILKKSTVYLVIWTLTNLYLMLMLSSILTIFSLENTFVFKFEIPIKILTTNIVIITIFTIINLILDAKNSSKLLKV